jgi:hypothetical protein
LVQIILGQREFKFVQIKGQVFFKGEIIIKMGWDLLYIFFSRTTRPILTRPGTNHPWEEGVKSDQLKGIALFQGKLIAKK